MSEPITLPPEVPHGTINAYNNYECRCDPCKLAWRVYQLPRVTRRKAQGLRAGDKRHGTYNGYANYRCRCKLCVEANRQYALGYQVRKGGLTMKKAKSLGWNGNV